MTDNEIIKALECHADRTNNCELCPLFEDEFCASILAHNSLDLIIRQQAEIESLKSLCTSKDVIINSQEAEIEKLKNSPIIGSLCQMWKAEARVEAIKEFAEKFKKKVRNIPRYHFCFNLLHVEKDIDDLVAEMTGKEDEGK